MKKFLATTAIALCLSSGVYIDNACSQDATKIIASKSPYILDDEKIHFIVLNGTPDDVKEIIKYGYDINKSYNCNTLLNTAIKSAASGQHANNFPEYAIEKIKILLKAGANVNKNACPDKAMSPLAWAATLPYQMDVNVIDINNIIDEKIKTGTEHCDIPTVVSKPCKDITPKERLEIRKFFKEGYRSATKILMPYFMKTTKLLVDNGADIDGKDIRNQTVLHHTVIIPQDITLEPLKYLIEKGADVNAQDIHGYTPLFFAYGSGNTDAVDMLIGAGADTAILSKTGITYNQSVGQRKRNILLDDGIMETDSLN